MSVSSNDLYPTRKGGVERLHKRIDEVAANTPFPGTLTPSQVDFYRENGYLVLDSYMKEEVPILLNRFNALSSELQGRPECVTEPDSDVVRTIFDPYSFDKAYKGFFESKPILSIAKQLLGTEAYLHQSRINVKRAFSGKSFPWHSDFETWHSEDGMPRMKAMTIWIMLTANTPENGSLMVIPKSHNMFVECTGKTEEDNHKTSLKNQVLGVPSNEMLDNLIQHGGLVQVTGNAGTVVIHDCNLMHGSPDNLSNMDRTIAMGVYNSTQNLLLPPFGGTKPRPEYLANRHATRLRGI